MLRYPRSKCQGILHVSSFAYGENALHGKGIYAIDAVAWLSNVSLPFDVKNRCGACAGPWQRLIVHVRLWI